MNNLIKQLDCGLRRIISMLAPDSQMLLFTEMNVRVSMEFFIFIIIRMISVVA